MMEISYWSIILNCAPNVFHGETDATDEHTLLIVVEAAQEDLGTKVSDQFHAVPTLGLT